MYKIVPNSNAICATKGFYADGISAGLKPNNQKDMAFIYSDTLCDVAAIYTSNKMLAAPLVHAKQKGKIQSNFILVNSKNANAMTGQKGIDDVQTIMDSLESTFETIQNPLMSSTGVIGVHLPVDKIIEATKTFDLSSVEPIHAAHAIMTTDKFSKTIAFDVSCEDGTSFTIGAMAKGAGMINPAMATMLCFISTDINIDQDTLQGILAEVNTNSFNAVSVDGDTSTNDTVFIMNSKQSDCSDAIAFKEALTHVMTFLAKELVRDGEGATKLVTYTVTGAKNNQEAEKVAKTLSNSLLIKTALYGEDPNWGRIAMSVGASGVECDQTLLSIAYDEVTLFKKGINLFDGAKEIEASAVMKQDSFTVFVDIGVGAGTFTAYGCDLGHEYIKINADYRT